MTARPRPRDVSPPNLSGALGRRFFTRGKEGRPGLSGDRQKDLARLTGLGIRLACSLAGHPFQEIPGIPDGGRGRGSL
jgi:hypothetical protein